MRPDPHKVQSGWTSVPRRKLPPARELLASCCLILRLLNSRFGVTYLPLLQMHPDRYHCMLITVDQQYQMTADLRARFSLIELCRDDAGEKFRTRKKALRISSNWSVPRTIGKPLMNHGKLGQPRGWFDPLCCQFADGHYRRAITAESGCDGRFWFRSAVIGKDARNATYSRQICTIFSH